DSEIQAIFAGNFEIDQRRVEAADLHHVDDEIRAAQRLANIERRLDLRVRAKRLSDFATEGRADFQPITVDVHVAERGVFEFRIRENVAGQVPRKHNAASADHGDFYQSNCSDELCWIAYAVEKECPAIADTTPSCRPAGCWARAA